MPELWMDVDVGLSEVPVNILPLLNDTDFKTVDETIAYNESGMTLFWHFTTPAGATTVTAVTPTTGGDYDWAHQDHGMYTIEIPASGGASINNDTEGHGWFTGVCDAVLPWRGPVITFRAAGLNGLLIESAYSATRGLAGTAVPDAAANAAGGLPISAGGALALDGLSTEAKLLAYVQLMTRKDAAIATDNATEQTAINADGGSGGGAYVNTSDSNEAIGDGAEDGLAAVLGAGWTDESLEDIQKILETTAHAQPGQEAPAASQTLVAMITYLYKAWRNKQDSDGSTQQLYADDGSTVDQSTTIGEAGGTITKGEVGTGA